MKTLKKFLESILDKGNKKKTVAPGEVMKRYISYFVRGNGDFDEVYKLASHAYKSLDPDQWVDFVKGGKGYIVFKDGSLGPNMEFVLFERKGGKTVFRSRFRWYKNQKLNIIPDVCSNTEMIGKIGSFHGAQRWVFENADELYEVPVDDMVSIFKEVMAVTGIPSYYNKPAIKYAEKRFM